MSDQPSLPARTARISDETTAEIVRLAIRQVPHSEIGRRTGVHRHTVRRVLTRTRAALVINEDLAQARAESVLVYQEIQRTAWQAVETALERGRSPAMLLAEVRQAQARIDGLLGLAPVGPEDAMVQHDRFKRIVIGLIRAETPELASVLAKRLIDASREAAIEGVP